MLKCLSCDFLQTDIKKGYCCAACPLGRGHGPLCAQLTKMNNDSTLVIIPYRNRQEHLHDFINTVMSMFHENNISLLVVEQSQNFEFNRGTLLNIGVKERPDADVYIFHDVDTLPNQKIIQNLYKSKLHYYDIERLRQPHSHSFGNVCKFSNRALKLMNGHPNNIWGWGVEDRALYFRYLKLKDKLKLKPFTKTNGWEILPHCDKHRKYTKETEILSKYYWNHKNTSSSTYLNDGITTVRYTKYDHRVKTHIYTTSSRVVLYLYAHIHVELEK